MNADLTISIIAVSTSILVSLISGLIADTRSKTRVQVMTEKINPLESNLSESLLKIARLEQTIQEFTRVIDRLDNTKASREVVDGIKNDISIFRIDMDKRFDRLERLIQENLKQIKHNN